MIIGVPKEVKDHETRVALVPSAVLALREAGHTVLVETHAGDGSTLPDEEYSRAGAKIVAKAADVWATPISSSRSRNRNPPSIDSSGPVWCSSLICTSRRCPTHRSVAQKRRHRRCLRDHRRGRWIAAAAHAHERSRRPHVGSGGRAISGRSDGRTRRAARRRAWRGAGERMHSGRGRGRNQRGQDRCRHGRTRHRHRQESESAARTRRYFQRPHRQPGVKPSTPSATPCGLRIWSSAASWSPARPRPSWCGAT